MNNNIPPTLIVHPTRHGVIASYVHPGSSLGVLIEVGCESDFTARTDDFLVLVHDLAMQVAATNPGFIHKADVTQAALADASEKLRVQARQQGKPESMITRLVDNRMEQFHAELCLYEQSFIKEPAARISDLIEARMEKLGETIVVRRFIRMELGNADAQVVGAGVAGGVA